MDLNRRSLRKLLDELLRSDSDLQAFCVDYFPKVAHRFTIGMDRVDKVTTLLTRAHTDKIAQALREEFPEAAQNIEHRFKDTTPPDEPAPGSASSPEREGQLIHVPELPPHFLDRASDVEHMKSLVLKPPDAEVIATGRALRTGVLGMGGIGKTVLAASFARDRDVRRAFPDGIFWVTLGQNPPIAQRQAELCALLGEPDAGFGDEPQGKAQLTEFLARRACLIVLDDVWHLDHIAAFGATGPRGRVLFTTRDAAIVAGWDADAHVLEVLGDDQALKLLGDWSHQATHARPAEARLVIKQCGRLPLALAIVGATIRGRPDRFGNALRKLRYGAVISVHRQFPNYPYPNLLRALEVSLDVLDPASRACYLDFAVFPEDTHIPEAVLKTLWRPQGLDDDQIEDMLDLFVDRSLLRRDERGWLIVHDLQRDYLLKHTSDIPALHTRLLDAYAALCSRGWASGPDDGYFFAHLAFHLVSAGRGNELRRLLVDFEWLRAKLKATDPIALLGDFAVLRGDEAPTSDRNWGAQTQRSREGDPVARVEGAIRLSAHILARDSEQFLPQLLGRLGEESDTEIESLRASGLQSQRGIWLRPLATCLIPPGGPLVCTLSGHSHGVTAVAVTPDSERIVSGSRDGTLKVWNLHTGSELRTLRGHSHSITAVAVTPDSQWIVSSSSDCTLKVWDLHSGRELHRLSGHSSEVTAVAVTPDGQCIVSGSRDRTLKVWDLSSGRELRTLWGHLSSVTAVAVTTDGQWIISGSSDATLRVWDLHIGRELRTLSVRHLCEVTALAVTADGQHAVAGLEFGLLMVWDVRSGRSLSELWVDDSVLERSMTDDSATVTRYGYLQSSADSHRAASVAAAAVTPAGRFAIAGLSNKRLKVWDLENKCEPWTFVGHLHGVTGVAVTRDGRFAVSGSNDKTVRIWELPTRELQLLSKRLGTIRALAVKEGWVVSGSDDRSTITLQQMPGGRKLDDLGGHSSWVSALAVTPCGRWVVSGSNDNTLRVQNRSLSAFMLAGHSGRMLAGHSGRVGAVAVTPDGTRVVSGSHDRTLKVWELQNGRELRTLSGHSAKVRTVAVTPDGKCVISGSDDRLVKVWDLESGRELCSLAGHSDRVRALVVTPDGKWAVSGSDDQTLKMWNLNGGREFRTLSGHAGGVRAVALTPDGRWAISGSVDCTIRVWDLQTGAMRATFMADSLIYAVAIADDGRSVVAGDALGMMYFLHVEGV